MPQIRIEADDQPINQFLGPVSAGLLLKKHQAALQAAFPDEGKFGSSAEISGVLLDLLYNPNNTDLVDQIKDEITAQSAADGQCFNDAITIARAFSSELRLTSIQYMNSFFAKDLRFLGDFARIPNLGDHIPAGHTAGTYFFNNMAAIDIPPIQMPTVHVATTQLGMYADGAGLDTYAQAHSYLVYNGNGYDVYTYQNYAQLYGGYGPDYQGDEQAYAGDRQAYGGDQNEDINNLASYIDNQMQNAGFGGWRYKDGASRFSADQLQAISKKVFAETGQLDIAAGVASFTGFTQYKRTLEEQVKASMSECAKSDKTIKGLLRRG